MGVATGRSRRTFKIHACLGRGGFGEVYRATMYEGEVHREVALKVLLAESRHGDQAMQRLRDERRMLAAVDHANILRVHDLVVLEGRIGLVTEYIEGQDLDKCNQSTDSMTPRALLEVIACVADALDHAWHAVAPGGGRLELVHRDIKPANVRIGRRGEVKLLDFGVARAENVGREAKTEFHSAMGSFPYMAPERFLDATPRASGDVHGLGVTAYEALAGERLWQVPLQELYKLALNRTQYQRLLEERLDALALPDLRPALTELLEYEPGKRPTAAQARDRLRELASRLPGDGIVEWARGRRWPEVRALPGMLAGRVFEEDDVDPAHAVQPIAPLLWDHADQEPTVNVAAWDAPTVLRTPAPAAGRTGAGAEPRVRRTAPESRPSRPRPPGRPASGTSARPAGTDPDADTLALRPVHLAQILVGLSVFGVFLIGVFVVTFTTMFAILRQWG